MIYIKPFTEIINESNDSIKYYVIATHRQAHTINDIKVKLGIKQGKKIEFYEFKSFDSLEEALSFYKNSFFDDCQYNIYQVQDGNVRIIDWSKIGNYYKK